MAEPNQDKTTPYVEDPPEEEENLLPSRQQLNKALGLVNMVRAQLGTSRQVSPARSHSTTVSPKKTMSWGTIWSDERSDR